MNRFFLVLTILFALQTTAIAQTTNNNIPVMETGGKKMPDVWIDKDTGHKVMKLTRRHGANRSFYFHNDPFINDHEMVFVGTDVEQASSDMQHGSTTCSSRLKILTVCSSVTKDHGIRLTESGTLTCEAKPNWSAINSHLPSLVCLSLCISAL